MNPGVGVVLCVVCSGAFLMNRIYTWWTNQRRYYNLKVVCTGWDGYQTVASVTRLWAVRHAIEAELSAQKEYS